MFRLVRTSLALVVVVGSSLAAVASLPFWKLPPPEWAYETDLPLELGHFYGPHGVYDEGEPVPLERGFQGGQHINVNLATAELATGEEAYFVAWLVDPDDERVLAGPDEGDIAFFDQQSYPELAPGKVYALGRLFIDEPDAILGKEAELRVQLKLPDDRVARAWHRGVVEYLPDGWNDVPLDAGVVDDGGAPDAGP